MDMAAWLDEMTYRLLACAENGTQAGERLAIIRYWAYTQGAQLQGGGPLRAAHQGMVDEALAQHEYACGPHHCEARRSGRGYARLMAD
jgi:hypothetical protein